jgi:transcriptional regulator with XRE-family HTH domain
MGAAAEKRDERAAGVGGDLRALRKSRGLTLAELALALGRSVGWLSQVERGVSQPTIADLRAIAAQYAVPMSLFFGPADAPEAERGHVVRGSAGRSLGAPEGGLSETLLSPDLGGAFEIIRSVFEPGAEKPDLATRPTEEAGYLVSGALDLWIGERMFHLAAGDAFRFRGEPYRWRNPGPAPAVVIWVIAPPVY